MDKKQKLLSIIGGMVLVSVLGVVWLVTSSALPPKKAVIPTPVVTQIKTEDVSYKGQNGIDALTLLKKQGRIEQDKSGLVTAINNRKADNSKHEYWAFYVNGKPASVGPAAYKTKDSDSIEWKIEKY